MPAAAMMTRPIPSTGEAMPVIGLGTWRAFDVGSDETGRRPLRQVLQRLLDDGGRIIDTSPMYGQAEAVTGDLLAESGAGRGVFSRPRCGRQAVSAGSSRCGARLTCCAPKSST
ncbi:MAG TPA: aldo/keto reductase [Stellaceae bacterium]|nr:aldo/keto reductase [Stellaceae bacterium]